jgi:hypothetical protein
VARKQSTAADGVTAAGLSAQAPKTKANAGYSVQAVYQTACLRPCLSGERGISYAHISISPVQMSSVQIRPGYNSVIFNRVANLLVTTFTSTMSLPLPPALPSPLSEPDLRRPKANPLLPPASQPRTL